jgi:hypothetical protein
MAMKSQSFKLKPCRWQFLAVAAFAGHEACTRGPLGVVELGRDARVV